MIAYMSVFSNIDFCESYKAIHISVFYL